MSAATVAVIMAAKDAGKSNHHHPDHLRKRRLQLLPERQSLRATECEH
jgi:hypothetical protein